MRTLLVPLLASAARVPTQSLTMGTLALYALAGTCQDSIWPPWPARAGMGGPSLGKIFSFLTLTLSPHNPGWMCCRRSSPHPLTPAVGGRRGSADAAPTATAATPCEGSGQSSTLLERREKRGKQ